VGRGARRDVTGMSGHGFRAVARTILDEVLGVRPDYIEHQLAHAVRDPNGRAYNRTAHLCGSDAAQLWLLDLYARERCKDAAGKTHPYLPCRSLHRLQDRRQ
jgi:hypothetical protein